MAEQKGKGKALAIGLLIGAIAGAIAALLFAPKSGNETREGIKRTIGMGQDREAEKERSRDSWR